LSPCIVLLDNLDMLLGASAAESDAANNGDSQTSSRPSGTGGRGVRSARTRHQAVDRMLSTLLVEIDGVYTTSSSAGTTAAQVPPRLTTAVSCVHANNFCVDRFPAGRTVA
jgi:SpoVK/Ycf46/Vps4 family AAA+-type ATPase